MKVISTPNSKHLLSASLESLHQETVEWIEDIAFWRDEIAFLYSLELKDTLKSVPVDERSSIRKIENEIVKIAGGDIDKLEDEVEQHEVSLYGILTNKSNDEAVYREQHVHISAIIAQIEKRIRVLKSEIYRLAKLSSGNLKKDVPGFREPGHPGVQK
jgi:hypothetical protein